MSLSILATSFLAGCNSSISPEEEVAPDPKENDPTADAPEANDDKETVMGSLPERPTWWWLSDKDKDGYRRFRDCNDNDASVYKWLYGYTDADADTYTVGEVERLCTDGVLPAGNSATQSAIEDCDDTDQSIFEEITGYEDVDGDSYTTGSGTAFCTNGTLSSDYTDIQSATDDCDDSDPYAYQNLTGYTDADSDSYTVGSAQTFCTDDFLPEGKTDIQSTTDDCDDGTSSVYPNATETPYDGIDQDCNGADLTDVDGDGVSVDADCDDTDGTVSQNVTVYVDIDGDAYTVGTAQTFCTDGTLPSGYTDLQSSTDDCDDADPYAYQNLTGYTDADSDSYTVGSAQTFCTDDFLPEGNTDLQSTTDDCDDTDGTVSQNVTGYVDVDGDGATTGSAQTLCTDGSVTTGYSGTQSATDDCDDTNGTTYQNLTGYTDVDADGYTIGAAQTLCSGAALAGGYSATSAGDDCDDSDSATYQNLTGYTDLDADGYTIGAAQTLCSGAALVAGYSASSAGDDCDDTDSASYQTLTGYTDVDADGYTIGSAQTLCSGAALAGGYSATSAGTDCDDTTSGTNPGATEVCNDGIDNDCSDDGSPECRLSGTYDLTSEYDARTRGNGTDQVFGVSLGNADIDGDGYDDWLRGSPDFSESTAGFANVRNGSASGLVATSISLDGDIAGDLAGYSVAGVGDVDGDGVEDMIVGAMNESSNANNSGAAYVVSGVEVATDTLYNIALSITYGDDANNIAGSRVAGAGDVNSDGYSDILVSAPGYGYAGWYAYGAAYLNYGPLTSDIDLSASDVIITGAAVTDYTGSCLGGGDVNGDGNSDILVGSYMNWDNGNDGTYGAGRADLFYGPVASGSYDINDSNVQIYGETGGDMLGLAGTIKGDIDGDGHKDIVVCATQESSVDDQNGACYLFLGSSTLSGALYAGTDSYTKWVGTEEGTYVGVSVASGDLNSDGYDDVIIGANGGGNPVTSWIGGAYVFYGPVLNGTVSVANADAIFTGESQGDLAGSSVGTGNFNGDGKDDVTIGAPYYDYTASITNSGAAYAIYGTGE